MKFAILIFMVFYASASKSPDRKFTFDHYMDGEDNVEIVTESDYEEFDMPDVPILMPSSNRANEEIIVVGQSIRDPGTLIESSEDENDDIRVIGQVIRPPPSPDVIEIIALDENSTTRPFSRKRPAPANPTSSKKAKVCFKKDKNSRQILLQDPDIEEVRSASRDPSVAGPSGASSRPLQPFIGEAGPSGMQKRRKSQDDKAGRLGKGKAKNPHFKRDKKEEPEKSDIQKISKDPKVLKINDLKMRKMGYIKNCQLSFKTTYLGGTPQVDILCNTDYGKMSVAQYRQIYCGDDKEREEESVEDIDELTTLKPPLPTTTSTPITDNEFYQRISSSTTPRPGFLGGRSTLTMAADVSHGAVFHSCAKLMSMKRKRRAIPLIFGGLMTMIIASIATQQSISNKIANPECPQGYIKFAHRCVREQPEKCPIGMINISFFNYTTVE